MDHAEISWFLGRFEERMLRFTDPRRLRLLQLRRQHYIRVERLLGGAGRLRLALFLTHQVPSCIPLTLFVFHLGA